MNFQISFKLYNMSYITIEGDLYMEEQKVCLEFLKRPDTIPYTLIMIFVEGTVLKTKSLFSLYNPMSYVPIGNCVNIINGWQQQGAEIVYCTSRRKQAPAIARLLKQFAFAGTRLYFRGKGQRYNDIAEIVLPDILIEDNCRSIGGSWQMCITHVAPDKKEKIKSVVVKEFKGIDSLPVSLPDLLLY